MSEENFKGELEALEAFKESRVYPAAINASHSESGRDELIEFQIYRKKDYELRYVVYKAQWTKYQSRGRDPQFPRVKTRLPFDKFLTLGLTTGMKTPDQVIEFIHLLRNGFGITINFDQPV